MKTAAYKEVPIILKRYTAQIQARAEELLAQQFDEDRMGTEAIEAFATEQGRRDHELTDDEYLELIDEVIERAAQEPALRAVCEEAIYDTLREARIWWYLKDELKQAEAVTQYYAPLVQRLITTYAAQNQEAALRGLDDWGVPASDLPRHPRAPERARRRRRTRTHAGTKQTRRP